VWADARVGSTPTFGTPILFNKKGGNDHLLFYFIQSFGTLFHHLLCVPEHLSPKMKYSIPATFLIFNATAIFIISMFIPAALGQK
jgi:hypothetical protein